ncbi:hypothetical protein CJ209_12000 [Fusobacterium nucleatum]|jgi:hypothetical protein|uniref:DUF3990 domain-containing protein n=1 Tax=Fusobacterium nucleatum TaxID=851 RepID=A0A2N6TEA6_FUSNU|nr:MULTISPECIES: hypothetical protein [Fusobacterium]ERT31350.1 hypothetical protein HMPREF1766_02187 [Fusobacterium nucleatum CTI-5]OFQ55521.1 hypothetical protein HMPREF2931_00180 [Fusobacterium sp. HMSC065F01]PMC67681.1 hypothetical protein CJ209_12000 [Fusobacterium nucleatum]CDA08283.1 uncharacterized protein BN748_00141 [Fusobacterium sp. CAG:649]
MLELRGFHGTNKFSFKKIKEEGFNICKNGWFGSGVYFYKDSVENALKWSKKKYKDNNCVIEINLKIEDKFVFDVTDANKKDVEIFHKIRKELIEQMQKVGNLAIDSRKNFDNVVFNYISKNLKKQIIIGNSFTYDEYNIPSRVPNGIEICIIDTRIIALKDLKEVER